VKQNITNTHQPHVLLSVFIFDGYG